MYVMVGCCVAGLYVMVGCCVARLYVIVGCCRLFFIRKWSLYTKGCLGVLHYTVMCLSTHPQPLLLSHDSTAPLSHMYSLVSHPLHRLWAFRSLKSAPPPSRSE